TLPTPPCSSLVPYTTLFRSNFSGRQNDIQGKGDLMNGNWITGINFIDDKVLGLGNQSQLTSDMKENKGRNVYFMLPFILAVIGRSEEHTSEVQSRERLVCRL